jgi:hypothetical protein
MPVAYNISRLTQRWEKCADNEGDFVVKYFEFCEGCAHDVCKFNCICNYSFWKIHRRHYFRTAPHIGGSALPLLKLEKCGGNTENVNMARIPLTIEKFNPEQLKFRP